MHSEAVHGLSEPLLICAHRPGYRGLWYAVGGAGVCAGFRRAVDAAELPAGVRAVPLTQGKVALVDAADYERLIRYSWCLSKTGKRYRVTSDSGDKEAWYAVRRQRGRTIRMHRQIMGAQRGQVVDHINHDGLDNRRCNLRLCSPAENAQNLRAQRGRSSRYKGVSYVRRSKKWRASISRDGQGHYLGLFESEAAAARAYNEKARELFGAFACLNEVESGSFMPEKEYPQKRGTGVTR